MTASSSTSDFFATMARPPSRAERIARIDSLATLLDTAFVVPGTQIRFGLDALIGLVPGIGDAITTALSLYIVREARALGAPRLLVARMMVNVAVDGLVAEGDFRRASGADAAIVLLDHDVDAIFCANDATAAGALDSIRARGLRVPDDVALAGFDDLDFAAHLDPPLTTVRQGIHAQGEQAAHTLSQLLDDPDGGPRRVILPTELVIRRSTVGGVQAP